MLQRNNDFGSKNNTFNLVKVNNTAQNVNFKSLEFFVALLESQIIQNSGTN